MALESQTLYHAILNILMSLLCKEEALGKLHMTVEMLSGLSNLYFVMPSEWQETKMRFYAKDLEGNKNFCDYHMFKAGLELLSTI